MGNKLKKIAIIGTNGLPARYGGFETLIDHLTKNLRGKYVFQVYCSKTPLENRLIEYNNAKLVYLPFKANGIQSIIYDIISTFHAWFSADVLLVLGPSAGFILLLNALFRKKLIVNHGGLEWEREKRSFLEKKYSKMNHWISAFMSDYSVTDNEILKTKINQLTNRNPVVIRYGGDHVEKVKITPAYCEKYPFLSEKYAVSVSRAQVDNYLHLLLEAFEEISNIKLVLISNWQVSKYGLQLKEKYKQHRNMYLLDAIYDTTELNLIRGNAVVYIHSHSRCGTAPSLVEAISLELPIISFNVPTNRETTQEKAVYFSNKNDLVDIVKKLEQVNLDKMKEDLAVLADREYTWEKIAAQYSRLFDGIETK